MANRTRDKRSSRWDLMTDAEKEAFRETMRKVMRKKFKDPVHREKMKKSHQTPEFRRLRSEIMSDNYADPVFVKKLRDNNYDNPEVKKQKVKKFIQTRSNWSEEKKEEFKRMRSRIWSAWLTDPENWEKMYEANWGNEKVTDRRRQSWKKTWDQKSDSEIVDFAKAVIASGLKGPNRPEKQLIEFFKKYGFGYNYTGAGGVYIAGYRPDFTHPEYNLVIEFDGNYWHSRDQESYKRDKRRNLAYKNKGYKLLILRDEDLQDEDRLLTGMCIFEAKYKTSATRRLHRKMDEGIV